LSSAAFKVRRLESGPAGAARVRRASRYSRAEIVRAIQVWAEQYGEPPAMIDWDPARARRLGHAWRAERFDADQWPSARMVSGHFPSFNAAVEAAGLQPRRTPTRLRPNLAGSSAILEAIVEWTRRYGDVPTMADWDPVRARRLKQDWRIARYRQGDWPSARSVAHHFGSFASAIAAAGLVPRPPSRQWADRSEDRAANRLAVAQRQAAGYPAAGLEHFATKLSALAAARTTDDPVALHAALMDVAASAIAWAEIHGVG
jgi:hypothetical protein